MHRQLWQHFLLTALRRALKGNRPLRRQIGRLYRKYPSGFIVNVMSRYRIGGLPETARLEAAQDVYARRIHRVVITGGDALLHPF